MTSATQHAAPRHRRWWLWLPLLAACAWLAVFGDKSPAGDEAASLPARSDSTPGREPASAQVRAQAQAQVRPQVQAPAALASPGGRPTPSTHAAAVAAAGTATRALAEESLALLPRAQLIPLASVPPRATAVADARRRDLFASRSWAPPPVPPRPVVVPVPAPAAPVAPPLPYTFLGKKLEAGTWEVYLARGERTVIAKEGTVLDTDYRVERIAPPQLTFTYLPLGQTQTLAIGEAH